MGPGWLFDVVRDGSEPFRVVTIRAPEDFPVAIACTGVVVVGRSLANMDPSDRGALWKASVAFVRTIVGPGVPYLGIGDGACYGRRMRERWRRRRPPGPASARFRCSRPDVRFRSLTEGGRFPRPFSPAARF